MSPAEARVCFFTPPPLQSECSFGKHFQGKALPHVPPPQCDAVYFCSAPYRDGEESSLSASTVPSAKMTLLVRPTIAPLLAWYTYAVITSPALSVVRLQPSRA